MRDIAVVNSIMVTLALALVMQSAAGTPSSKASEGSREQALNALKQRAESGDVKAQVQLGSAYASGDGVAA
jgi:TPR repeat protein